MRNIFTKLIYVSKLLLPDRINSINITYKSNLRLFRSISRLSAACFENTMSNKIYYAKEKLWNWTANISTYAYGRKQDSVLHGTFPNENFHIISFPTMSAKLVTAKAKLVGWCLPSGLFDFNNKNCNLITEVTGIYFNELCFIIYSTQL